MIASRTHCPLSLPCHNADLWLIIVVHLTDCLLHGANPGPHSSGLCQGCCSTWLLSVPFLLQENVPLFQWFHHPEHGHKGRGAHDPKTLGLPTWLGGSWSDIFASQDWRISSLTASYRVPFCLPGQRSNFCFFGSLAFHQSVSRCNKWPVADLADLLE